jgi:hypothetical protein
MENTYLILEASIEYRATILGRRISRNLIGFHNIGLRKPVAKREGNIQFSLKNPRAEHHLGRKGLVRKVILNGFWRNGVKFYSALK